MVYIIKRYDRWDGINFWLVYDVLFFFLSDNFDEMGEVEYKSFFFDLNFFYYKMEYEEVLFGFKFYEYL